MPYFGLHLTIDGYGGDKEKLNSASLVRDILNDLPRRLKMKKLTDPLIKKVPPLSEKDPGGISGFVIISESHISIHAFPDRGFISIDVYTCQNQLDKDFVIQYFTEKFNLQETETNFIVRGTKYPLSNQKV